MADFRSADPEHLDALADRLSTGDNGASYGRLVDIVDRARRLGVTAEVTRLTPLLTWLQDAADQLRSGAAILRGDSPTAGMSAADLAAGYASDSDGTWEWETFGAANADAFVALARQDDLSAEDLDRMRGLLAPFADNPDFAGHLIDALGMEDFLALSLRIDAAAADLEDTHDADTLRTLLGTALVGAMWVPGTVDTDSAEYREWTENTPQGREYAVRLAAFNRVGGQLMGYEEGDPIGFEVAIGLLERSDLPIDAEFFHQSMTRLAAPFEMEGDVCARWPQEVPDRLLALAARTNPRAAEAYLDFPDQAARVEWFTGLVGRGAEMTDTERATLSAVLENNAGDPAFSEHLLRELGPDGAVGFAALLVDGAHDGDLGAAAREDFARLQSAFADSFATGMRDTEAQGYTDFMSGLPEAGIEEYSVGFIDEDVRGYQLLVSLLQEGNGYADAFMFDIADGIRRAEDPDLGGDPTIWREYRPANADMPVPDPNPEAPDGLDPEEHEWFTLDPLDAMLGVMSRDPQAATTFLDPQGGNDRLAYLISEREWRLIDEAGGAMSYGDPTDPARPSGIAREADNVRTGLGLLLHAATTGHELGNPAAHGFHTPEQTRVMHKAIELFDADKDGDELLAGDSYENVRLPFAAALAAYSADTFNILSGLEGGYGGQRSAGIDAGDGLGRLNNARASVIRVMRGLSATEDDLNLLAVAQRDYIVERLVDMPQGYDSQEDIELRAAESRRIGEVFGSISAIGADMLLDGRDDQLRTNMSVMRYTQPPAALLGYIPVVGSRASDLANVFAFEWWRSADAEAREWAHEELGDATSESRDEINGIFREWGRLHGLDELSGPVEGAAAAGQDGFTSGRNDAHEALRGAF